MPTYRGAQVSLDDIARYYDTHQGQYSRFWSPVSLHYGFWFHDTKTLAEAIRNTDKFVINILSIGSEDVVLDAGCGIGGTSFYIAEVTGARVEGITLSEVQLNVALSRAAQSVATHRLGFSKQDYTHTTFYDETFSKLFGIESVCHAGSKVDFLKEAWRILKPGGKIAIVDAFLIKENLDVDEQIIYKKFIEGWVVPDLPSQAQFSTLLAQAGFENCVFHDMQRFIAKSVNRIHQFSMLTSPWNFIKSKLGLARENLSAWYQKELFERSIAVYGVFVAEKADMQVKPGLPQRKFTS
jgi:tocopherol O-methyltransferase